LKILYNFIFIKKDKLYKSKEIPCFIIHFIYKYILLIKKNFFFINIILLNLKKKKFIKMKFTTSFIAFIAAFAITISSVEGERRSDIAGESFYKKLT